MKRSRRLPGLVLASLLVAAFLLLSSAAQSAGRGPAPSRPGGTGLDRACDQLARTLTALERPIVARHGAAWGPHFARFVYERLEQLRAQAARNVARSYADGCVALNQVQVLGTHNSYHVQPRPELFEILTLFDPSFLAWEYTHLPLADQFEGQGIRQIELDVFADPAGGLYAERRGLLIIGQDPASGLPELDEPGLKVLHVQDVDFETRCTTFVRCLEDVKRWSDANPGHLPLMVLVEAKDEAIIDPLQLGFTIPVPFGPAEFDELDDEIRRVFPREQLITPDTVRLRGRTLEESVLGNGWPRLGFARGRILFALDNGGQARLDYIGNNPSLDGRVLFTNGIPGEPDAAFVKRNDPVASFDEIQDLVRTGYIVRTRADADTFDARLGDTTRRDAAIASGAQYVSTDYPVPNPDFGTGYQVQIPGGLPGRCNPVHAAPACRAEALERLAR